jgi:hypothetical protein
VRRIGFVLAYDPEGLFAAITAWMDSLKVLDPEGPIREADMSQKCQQLPSWAEGWMGFWHALRDGRARRLGA